MSKEKSPNQYYYIYNNMYINVYYYYYAKYTSIKRMTFYKTKNFYNIYDK